MRLIDKNAESAELSNRYARGGRVMRLIDADEAIRRIRKLWVETDEPIEEAWRHSDYAFALYDAIEAVDDTPDAAGVITCRDCVYCETRIIRGEMVGYCEFFGDTKLYHYCGLAEARE